METQIDHQLELISIYKSLWQSGDITITQFSQKYGLSEQCLKDWIGLNRPQSLKFLPVIIPINPSDECRTTKE